MEFKSTFQLLKYIIPFSLTIFFILFFMKKNNTDYVSVEIDIPSNNEIVGINKKSSSINKFQLRPLIPVNKNEIKSTLSALNNNPFEELGTTESSYNQLPSDLRFTGILQVGDKEGVFVSSTRGLDVFYSGQEVSKGYKIMSINPQKAEIIISNGLTTKLVKLEQD